MVEGYVKFIEPAILDHSCREGIAMQDNWCTFIARTTVPHLVSVRQLHEGLQSLRSMRRMEARRRNASALWLRFSQSRARRRHRLSHAMVRSTIQRLGSTTKPLACLLRLTISTARLGIALAAPVWKIGPA